MPIPTTDPLVTVPMVTPFNEKDEVDYDAAQKNVERWLKSPLSGFLIGSQSGEEFLMRSRARF